MAVFSCKEGQDVYSISVVSDQTSINPHSPSQLAFLSFLEVPYRSGSQMCLDGHWSCKDCIDLQLESADRDSPCSVGIDIENENSETLKTNDKAVASSMKADSALTSASRRKISLQIGGKIMQFLMNHNSMLLRYTSRDNSTTERAHDTPSNKWRRYKRAALFDSRNIVLLFSILSSMGTMVLIYLTLRVKHVGDGLVHV